MRNFVYASMFVIASSGAALAQDAAAGEQSFKKCTACHAVGESAKNKIGPELNGLDGRKSASVEGYSYSDANKKSGLTWGESTFKAYIANPKANMPGTKMVFPGIKNASDADDLWAYLKQFDETGKKK
jgi:cytochrome c